MNDSTLPMVLPAPSFGLHPDEAVVTSDQEDAGPRFYP